MKPELSLPSFLRSKDVLSHILPSRRTIPKPPGHQGVKNYVPDKLEPQPEVVYPQDTVIEIKPSAKR